MRPVLFMVTVVIYFASSDTLGECRLTGPSKLLSHVKGHHPHIAADKARTETYREAISKSKQRPNPRIEMGIKTATGDFGGEGSNIGAEFKHVVELGGKREARVKVSKKRLNEQKVRERKTKEHAVRSTVKIVNKLHQTNELISRYTESISSFTDVLKSLEKLPSKSPAERVEVSTLQVAIQNYEIKRERLKGQKESLLSRLQFFVADNCEVADEVYGHEATLASISDLSFEKLEKGSDLTISKREVVTQRARLELERSQGWSNLEIGPAIDYTKTNAVGTEEEFKVGLALEFSLPIFHTNDGGKSTAIKKLKEKKTLLKNKRKELQLELQRRLKNYRHYKKRLGLLDSKKEVNKKHKEVESLFSRGTIPTNLIIEVHRQLINWQKDKFHFHQLALSSLWRIYEMTGEISNAKY